MLLRLRQLLRQLPTVTATIGTAQSGAPPLPHPPRHWPISLPESNPDRYAVAPPSPPDARHYLIFCEATTNPRPATEYPLGNLADTRRHCRDASVLDVGAMSTSCTAV